MPTEKKTLEQNITINASPHDVFEAYMDTKKHIAFTGDQARIDRQVGGTFTAGNGYIKGKNLEIIPDEKIVQEWQANEEGWPKGHFSIITIELSPVEEGTKLDFTQEKLPKQCHDVIAQGWVDYYWEPLKLYLESPGHHATPQEEGDESEPTTSGKSPIQGYSGARLKKEHTKKRVREDDQVRVGRRERSAE